MVIKAIVFDIWDTTLRNKSNKIHDNLMQFIEENLGKSFIAKIMITNTNLDEFYNYFKQTCGAMKLKKLKILMQKHVKTNFIEFSDFEYVLPLIKDYKYGIISNCSFVTKEIVNNWGYKKIFDFVIYSYEEEIKKPDKKIFDKAVKKLNLKPNEILFIGNDYEKDYLGAKNAGLNALLIDRKNEHKEIKERITSFKQLENYLKKINKN